MRRCFIVAGTVLMLFSWVLASGAKGPAIELPRPDCTKNVFLVIVGQTTVPEATVDAEGEEVYTKLGPNRIYVRVWYGDDGECSPEIHKKHNGYRRFFWGSPLDTQKLAFNHSGDRRDRQWSQKGRAAGEIAKLGHRTSLTASGYAREVYEGSLEMVRQDVKKYLDLKKRDRRVLLFCGPNEFEYWFGDRDFWPDYSPFAVAEFRDWLTHRGEYAKGGRFEGLGRKGGEAFADDPSPAKAKGKNKPFNDAFGTKFTTWKLLYWDLEAYPDPLPLDAPGMPASGERGHTEGGFDAPRKIGDPLWGRWASRDPVDPGYRCWRIHQSLREMYAEARKAGIPREEIWSRQRGIADHTVSFDDRGDAILASWMAITPENMVGYNLYGFRPERSKTNKLILAATQVKAAGAQFGTLEWHPSLDPKFKATEQEYLDWLECWWEAGARVVGAQVWLGMWADPTSTIRQGAMRIRDTGFDTAIRKFLASRPDRPWGDPPNQKYVPPRVRGLAFDGGTLTWEDRLWEGDPYPFSAWEEFGSFEVATCPEVDAKGKPVGLSSLGKPKEASFGVKPGSAKRYLIVRGLARGGGKGAWSEPLEIRTYAEGTWVPDKR